MLLGKWYGPMGSVGPQKLGSGPRHSAAGVAGAEGSPSTAAFNRSAYSGHVLGA
jgi:hypothetical protein